jgi:hypothetical protein
MATTTRNRRNAGRRARVQQDDALADATHVPIEPGKDPLSVIVENQVDTNVIMRRPEPPNIDDDASLILNVAIRNRTDAISFNRYVAYIDRVLCDDRQIRDDSGTVNALRSGLRGLADRKAPLPGRLSNVYAYELLKVATEAFLLAEITADGDDLIQPERDPENGSLSNRIVGNDRLLLGRKLNRTQIGDALEEYIGPRGLPYIDLIVDSLGVGDAETPFCYGVLADRGVPPLLELIWSYWHEEGMLVQTINAISLRFQNRTIGDGRDPLADLELDPLRPLNNLLWGYIQDENNRLTVARRAYEYDHQYGLSLYGKAVPKMRTADRRSKFLEAFHNLLHLASVFFKEQADTQVIPDGFPLLNALKEVHLVLAEGTHNQAGDLSWTARVEMLIQKYFLSRPEIREFLRGRPMVPYQEPGWMAVVDAMKTLQGWTDVSVRYFRDLAVYGEQLLLSLRYGNWSDIGDEIVAKNWANSWRFAVQGYIHAYRAVTGVDLSLDTNNVRLAAESYVQPSLHLRNRLVLQQRGQRNGR